MERDLSLQLPAGYHLPGRLALPLLMVEVPGPGGLAGTSSWVWEVLHLGVVISLLWDVALVGL